MSRRPTTLPMQEAPTVKKRYVAHALHDDRDDWNRCHWAIWDHYTQRYCFWARNQQHAYQMCRILNDSRDPGSYM